MYMYVYGPIKPPLCLHMGSEHQRRRLLGAPGCPVPATRILPDTT
jgi:hypothetical protein